MMETLLGYPVKHTDFGHDMPKEVTIGDFSPYTWKGSAPMTREVATAMVEAALDEKPFESSEQVKAVFGNARFALAWLEAQV